MAEELKARFEHTHPNLPLGYVCHTTYRRAVIAYMFGGWRTNTKGRMAVFFQVQDDQPAYNGWANEFGLIQSGVYTETLLKQFPDLPKEYK